MGKSSIHMQTATAGTILHNARENYSKSVVFTDEVNELWNDSKKAYKLYREELAIRSEAYTRRTKQKLQKNTSTMISAVINLEQHHTLQDLEELKNYIEKEFDTKIIQMAIHRDEGKLINKNNPLNKLVSGKDFFLNTKDNELYFDSKFTKKINMEEWEIEKNYHAHFEMLGIDSDGNSLRKKMNMYKLSQLQDFTAKSLKMERGNNNVEVVKENGVEKAKRKTTRNKKRLDTHEFKEQAKIINDFNLASDTEKQLLIEQATNAIEENKKTKEEKTQLKSDLDFVKNEFKTIREMLKGTGATREDFKKIDDLNKRLQNDLKNNDIDIKKATDEIKNLVIDLKLENKIKDEKIKELTNLAYSDVNYLNTNKKIPYKAFNDDKKKQLKQKDEKIKELENKINDIDEAIKKIDEMQDQINIFKNEIENQLKIIEEKDEKIKELENQNKALQEQNNVLLDENINLQNKINSRANMSDYEDIKKENESLKNENSFLKSTITKIINFANNKIKDFFKFKIYNDVIFKWSDDHLLLEDWEDRCNDRYKLETEYNKQIENELLKEKDFEKVEDTNKSNLSVLEKLNKNLDEFISPTKKKEDIEQFNNYDSFLNR